MCASFNRETERAHDLKPSQIWNAADAQEHDSEHD